MKKTRHMGTERKCELLGIGLFLLATLLCLTLVTLRPPEGLELHDLFGGNWSKADNLFGWPGAGIAVFFTFLFGDAAHILYGIFCIWGGMLLGHKVLDRLAARSLGLIVLILSMAGLLHMGSSLTEETHISAGGLLGGFMVDQLLPPFGYIGAAVGLLGFASIGLLLSTDFLCIHVFFFLKKLTVQFFWGNWAIAMGLMQLFKKSNPATAPQTAAVPRNSVPDPVPSASAPMVEAAAERTAPRVHTHTSAQLEPMDDIPEPEELEAPAPASEPVDLELPFDAIPEIEESAAEADEEEESVTLDLEPLSNNRQMTLDGTTASTEEKPKRLVRKGKKTADIEELPPDYKYPKRYTKPSIDMLDKAESHVIPNLTSMLRETSVLLEDTLKTFNIEARVTDVTRGPTITRFELEPAPGVKVSRFLSLADDIALALKAHRVRVEAPIPGKGRVGIEVPNFERDPVLIRDLLENRAFTKGKGQLNLGLGKDIAGDVKIADLATMPHLLVAGATGAGKTVCVKALLASLLFQHTPDEMQLILIDPKMVELSIFNDIPHLITPVVTDPKKAATALNWLIKEMEERYRLFADLRVRNIEVYNKSVDNGEIHVEGAEEDDTSVHIVRKLPYIVCIIDELADLMMLARAEVEDAIARLAQLARAVGIHLIIATQRPSVDVLTGVIKANFPARISFQVSSRVDSRCILDEIGAERLIGMGDLLYLPAGQSKPHRIQGAFVSDEEMNSLIAHLKTQAPPQYRDEIEKFGQGKDKQAEMLDEDDPLFEDAVRVVMETGQASISMVQRRLRVGYTRAARLIDMMELRGIVGPHTGSKAREILVETAEKD